MSWCCPPLTAAHQAAPSEITREAAVTKPVNTAARLALSAALRVAFKASLTRTSVSLGARPVSCETRYTR